MPYYRHEYYSRLKAARAGVTGVGEVSGFKFQVTSCDWGERLRECSLDKRRPPGSILTPRQSPAYPHSLSTWGDPNRKRRLVLRLLQREVAERPSVAVNSICTSRMTTISVIPVASREDCSYRSYILLFLDYHLHSAYSPESSPPNLPEGPVPSVIYH